MNKFIISTLLFFLITGCSSAQKAFYSSNDKKAIKAYEAALVCFNTIDPITGLPNVPCVESLLDKALKRDSTFVEAYSLASNMSVENGDIEKAIFIEKK